MLIQRKIRLALVFLTTTAGLIFSQEKATILHWTDRDGLSSNKVSAICRGSNGFVWIGTNNGLNKFDGYSIKPFYSSNKKQFRISSNLVYDIQESTDGKIWVATDKGLNRIDPNRNTTTFYDHSTMQQVALPNTSVRSILPDSSGMWLGCEARDLAFWDFSTNRITTYPFRSYAFELFPILRYKLFYISKIEKLNRDLYLLDANVGLFLFDRKKEKFECLDNYLGLLLERKSNFPRSFYHCSSGNTIASYNINNQSFKKITIGSKTAIFNEKPLVNNIVVVNDSIQCLLSDAGLFILNSTRGTAVKVTSTPYPYGQLNTAFKEIDGSIWVGGNEGLWFLKHSRIPFSERKLVTTVATGNHNLLNYTVEDEESRLRYCPENYGNNLYLLSTNGAFRKIPFEDELRFVTQTPDKSLWLSVGTSMKRQPKGAKVFSDFPIPNAVFDPNKKI